MMERACSKVGVPSNHYNKRHKNESGYHDDLPNRAPEFDFSEPLECAQENLRFRYSSPERDIVTYLYIP
jgi:hypothetical protein